MEYILVAVHLLLQGCRFCLSYQKILVECPSLTSALRFLPDFVKPSVAFISFRLPISFPLHRRTARNDPDNKRTINLFSSPRNGCYLPTSIVCRGPPTYNFLPTSLPTSQNRTDPPARLPACHGAKRGAASDLHDDHVCRQFPRWTTRSKGPRNTFAAVTIQRNRRLDTRGASRPVRKTSHRLPFCKIMASPGSRSVSHMPDYLSPPFPFPVGPIS